MSRTRGSRRPQLTSPSSPCSGTTLSLEPKDLFDGGEGAESEVSSLTDTSVTPGGRKYWKPPATRVIIEVNPVVEMLERHMKCPKCGAGLTVKFPSTCIATTFRIECTNTAGCTYVDLVEPRGSDVPALDDAGSAKIERNSDHAVNVLFAIAFIASGDGGTEAARLLGLLGLPNSTTMQGRSFGTIEKQLSPVIQSYAYEILDDNLKDEVALLFGDNCDMNGTRLYEQWFEKKLTEELWPRVGGCADMGWQQKGSGRKRNSKSGHALVVGMGTRKAIAMATCSKGCGYCKSWLTTHTVDEPPPEHKCYINHHGSSGSMEPLAVLQMYKDLYNKQVIVDRFVVDDDSSLKAKLKWSNEDHMINTNTTTVPRIINSKGNVVPRPNHGGVPRHMPEPSFVADPNHRRKTLSNGLYALAMRAKTSPEEQRKQYDKRMATRKAKREQQEREGNSKPTKKDPPFVLKPWNMGMNKSDCRRLSKNFAFMARTLQHKTTDKEIIDAGQCVLEHHFDNHEFCGDWCRRKIVVQQQIIAATTTTNNNKNNEQEGKFYRDKATEIELYNELKKILARFITLEALKEVAHNMDTCANESFNNTVSWLAPKNKVYCGTSSLKNRICVALGLTSLGTLKYYEGLFLRMGITMEKDVRHYLQFTGNNRRKRIERSKTTQYKRKRKSQEMDKIKKEAAEAAVDRAKRQGVYRSGIGMTGGYDECQAKKTTAKAPTTGRKPCICGGTDHQRTTSKKCKLNPKKQQHATEDEAKDSTIAEDVIADMADEMDQMDTLDLNAEDDDSSAFFSATSEFS